MQVLLKALHEFGDYDPPVMIDTVMGVFGSETHEAIVEIIFLTCPAKPSCSVPTKKFGSPKST